MMLEKKAEARALAVAAVVAEFAHLLTVLFRQALVVLVLKTGSIAHWLLAHALFAVTVL